MCTGKNKVLVRFWLFCLYIMIEDGLGINLVQFLEKHVFRTKQVCALSPSNNKKKTISTELNIGKNQMSP